MLKQPVPTRTRRFLARVVLGATVLAGSLSVYAAQPGAASKHRAAINADHFTLKIDIATRGHAPSMHFTQCLAKGKPFDLSGNDGPGFSWHGTFTLTPAANDQIQIAGDLHTRLDEGSGHVRVLDGKPIVRTKVGQAAAIAFGQRHEKPLEDGTVWFNLIPTPGCDADTATAIPSLAPMDGDAQARPMREAAQVLAKKDGFILLNADALSESPVTFKFDQMSPVFALQLLADIDGKRAVFNGHEVRFDPK